MALTISELDPLSALLDEDMLEVQKQADNRSYKITGATLANFIGNQSNGSFRGVVTSLDNMTNEHVGVWLYAPGSNSETAGFPNGGILEVISFQKFDSSNPNNVAHSIVQILHAVDGPYYRMVSINNEVSSAPGEWYPLANKNGNTIQYGETDQMTVAFDKPFRVKPAVTITPYITTPDPCVLLPMLVNVSTTGFTVIFYKSDVVAAQEITVSEESTTNNNNANTITKNYPTSSSSTTNETTQNGNISSEEVGNKVVKTTESTKIRGAWEVVDSVTYQWVATAEDSLWGYNGDSNG